MNKINKINVCCQKVLPLVYDESLSYYEVLCKVIQKLNELIKINNNIRDEVHSDYLAVLEGAKVATEAVASVTAMRDEVLTLKQATEQYAHDVATVYNQTVEARDTAIAKADIAERSATTASQKAEEASASASNASASAKSASDTVSGFDTHVAEKETELDTYTSEKKTELDTYTNTEKNVIDEYLDQVGADIMSAKDTAVTASKTATAKADIAVESANTATEKATEAQTNADKVLTAMSLVSGTINYYKGDNIEMTIYGGENDSMSVTITPTIRNNVLYIYGNVTQELTGQVTIHLPNIVTKTVNMTQVFDWAKTVLPNIDVNNLPYVTFGGGNGNTYTNGATQEKLISTVAGKSIIGPLYSLNMQLFSNTLSEITVPYQSGTTLKYSFTIIQPLVFTNEVTPDPTDYITKLNEETQAREQADAKLKGDITRSKEAIKDLYDKKITKFYASNLGETTMNDSDNGNIQDMILYGKSLQAGTPTPDNPIEIQSVVNPKLEVCGNNLLNSTLQTHTVNGVTCTNNGDGTYTLNGTSTDSVYFNFHKLALPKGKYNVIDCYFQDNNGTWNINVFELNKSTVGDVFIYIGAGKVINNVVYKPMITTDLTATSDDYEPYKGQTATLPYTLNAIPVSSGGNVTIDGQQYIADYVDIENKKLHRYVASSKFDETVSIIDNMDLLLSTPTITDLTDEEVQAFKELATYYQTTNVMVTSDQLDGYTTFNYPLSMANGWNLIKEQLGDTREYIYDIELQSAEAYVNSEYAVTLTELGYKKMLYKTLLTLKNLKGLTDDLKTKIDVFFAVGRITEEQYNELIGIEPVIEEPVTEEIVS